jgi:hypothetical protein
MPQLSENLRPERFNRRRRRSNRRFSVVCVAQCLHRADLSYVVRNNRRRTRYRLVSAQVTTSRFQFLVQPSVACLGEAEDALDDEEGMLDPGRACQKFCV